MDISVLRYFIVTAKAEHMNRAAKELHITQPSLSACIRRLEAELGCRLFDRNGRNIQLNESGKRFLEACVQMEALYDAALKDLARLNGTAESYIRLSCSGSSVNSDIIRVLLSKGISLRVNGIPERWAEALSGKQTDLVITMDSAAFPGISRSILGNRRLVPVVSSSHPLAKKQSVSLEELERWPFCSTDSDHSLLKLTSSAHPELPFRPQIAFLGRNADDMRKAIRSGNLAGIMVLDNLPREEDLVVLNVPEFDISLPISLYWRKEDSEYEELMKIRGEIEAHYREWLSAFSLRREALPSSPEA